MSTKLSEDLTAQLELWREDGQLPDWDDMARQAAEARALEERVAELEGLYQDVDLGRMLAENLLLNATARAEAAEAKLKWIEDTQRTYYDVEARAADAEASAKMFQRQAYEAQEAHQAAERENTLLNDAVKCVVEWLEDTRRLLTAAEAEVEKLRNSQASWDRIVESREIISTLEAEVARLGKELETAQANVKTLEAAMEEETLQSKQRLVDAETENEQLRRGVEAVRAKCEKAQGNAIAYIDNLVSASDILAIIDKGGSK